jgi:uncharacterized protein (TIGR03437 family)
VVPMYFCGRPSAVLPVCLSSTSPYDRATEFVRTLVLTPSSLAFAWQIGSSSLPAARTVSILTSGGPVTTKASVASGASWLSVTMPGQNDYTTISVTVNPSQLAVGTYQGSIVVSQSSGPASTLPVSLTVTDTAVPMISATPTTLSFSAPAFNAPPYSQTIAVTSDQGSTPFSVMLQPSTWLKVSPMSGRTPATLTVTWDPAVTSQFYYQQRSTPDSISISSLGNAISIPTTFNVTGVQTFQTYLGQSGMGPNGLVFSAQTGSPSQTQTINVDPAGAITATADQPWIAVVAPLTGPGANQTVVVTVNPTGLAPGVYHGKVTIAEAGIASIVVPVTLGVWSTPPQLTTTVSSFTFVQTLGEPTPANQFAEVDSGGVPIPLTITIPSGMNWLVADRYGFPTPTLILVGLNNTPQSPGEYDASFTIQSPGSSIVLPVTLLVEPGPLTPPVVSQVVNSASGIAGSVSPGEILTIRGFSVGAAAPSGLKFDASGNVASNLNGLQVTFDGQAAPLIYTSANQTNLIVPYEVASKTSTVMQVTYAAASGALQTAAWVLPVSASVPGVFTRDATGTGQGAILNQDGSTNSAANPAARGSVISIYATGEGQTEPAGVTGSLSRSTKTPLSLVTAAIGGVGAFLQYAGSAPGEIAGLLQVNAVVPQSVSPGSAVPVIVNVGGIASQAGVTVAVK